MVQNKVDEEGDGDDDEGVGGEAGEEEGERGDAEEDANQVEDDGGELEARRVLRVLHGGSAVVRVGHVHVVPRLGQGEEGQRDGDDQDQDAL